MDPEETVPTRIALGRPLDAFNRVPVIELQDGKIAFLPGQSMRDIIAPTEAAFPAGARLEYRIEMGDMYFDGDRGERLGCSLWVIEPDGGRKLLARDFNLYVDFNLAALNLKRAGIPFEVSRVYDGPNGQHLESDITPTLARSRHQLPIAFLVGTSSLWLGALAGFFIRDIWIVTGLGTVAFTVFAIAATRLNVSKRTAFLKLIATLPSYAGGYALAVVCVRHLVGR
jgi:hypothetical protein